MKWTIIQLQKEFRDHVMEIDEIINISKEMQQIDPEIRSVLPVHVTGKADIDSQKVVFHLHLTGKLILPCSRTLADVEHPFEINSTETFLLNPLDNERGETEEGVYEAEGGVIDLMPVFQELILLEVPMQVFCEEALEDENLPSGQGWEVMTEDQHEEQLEKEKQKVDPRLAGLAQLLEDKKK